MRFRNSIPWIWYFLEDYAFLLAVRDVAKAHDSLIRQLHTQLLEEWMEALEISRDHPQFGSVTRSLMVSGALEHITQKQLQKLGELAETKPQIADMLVNWKEDGITDMPDLGSLAPVLTEISRRLAVTLSSNPSDASERLKAINLLLEFDRETVLKSLRKVFDTISDTRSKSPEFENLRRVLK